MTTTQKFGVVQLQQLVTQYREMTEQIERAREQVKRARAEVVQRQLARQYDSWDEYIAASERLLEAKKQAEGAEAAASTLEIERKYVNDVLVHALPPLVWIRVGDVGVGVAHTNWGGSRHYVVIKPWQAEMPSLDHSYHGD